MKKYTGMYILKPTLTEDQIKANVEELNALFTSKGGEILSVEEWGLKELAYEDVLAKTKKCSFPIYRQLPAEPENLLYSELADYARRILREDFGFSWPMRK